MQVTVFLSGSYFAALLVMMVLIDQSDSCDTKWIRLVYMMSCGKKKRESVEFRNSTLTEPLPKDIPGVLQYYKDRDPHNPLFHDYKKQLTDFLKDEGHNETEIEKPSEKKIERKIPQAVLLRKLLPSAEERNYLGIPGFPDQWDIEELTVEKINENHRREIDRLIEECCKVPPVTNCNGNTFLGACK